MRVLQLIALLATCVAAILPMGAWTLTGVTALPDGPHQIVFNFRGAPSGRDWDGAARAALNSWNPFLQRVQLNGVSANVAPGIENGRDEMYFSPTLYGESWPSGVLAVTDYDTLYRVRVEADIIFNANLSWDVYAGPRTSATMPFDFRRVAVHELGHLLGLDHPDEATPRQTVTSVMNRFVSSIEVPTADDEAGARALYDTVTTARPLILTQPQAKSPKEDTVVTLTTLAGGQGPLTYQWLHNGAPVVGATNAMLKFTAAFARAGEYRVVVTGPAGATNSNVARIEMPLPQAPRWQSGTENLSVPMGESRTLNGYLGSAAHPSNQYQWLKNGIPLPDAPNAPTLVLNNIQFSDAGTYTVVATNFSGSAVSRPFVVSVYPTLPPVFTRNLNAGASYIPGSNVALEAPYMGDYPASLQWQKDGVDIPGATNRNLSVASLSAANAGKYTVTLTSALGRLTSSVADIVLRQPTAFTVTRDPAPVFEYYGETASFTVSTSLPATDYRWFKDRSPLPENDPRFSGVRSQTLTVSAIQREDAGLYWVEVSRDAEKRTTTPVLLAAFLRPSYPLFVIQPAPHTVPLGYTVRLAPTIQWGLDNQVSPAPSPVTFQWLKDGSPLPGATHAELVFLVQSGDAGQYRLRASWPGGSVESAEAEVALTAEEGIFTSHPPSRVLPYKGGYFGQFYSESREELENALRAGTVFYYTKGSRVYSDVDGATPNFSGAAVTGTYTVTKGSASHTATSRPFHIDLMWDNRPMVVKNPANTTAKRGAPLTLEVVVKPETNLKYAWRSGQDTIPGATSSSYTIPSFSPNSYSSYFVDVSNDHGVTRTETARVQLADYLYPTIASSLETETVVAEPTSDGQWRTSLSVFVYGGSPDLESQWFFNGEPLKKRGRLDLSSANGNAPGTYTYVVTNKNVTETKTFQVRVLGAPEIVYQPQSQSVAAGTQVSLGVGAIGNPVPDRFQWLKNGVPIPGATDAFLRLRNVPVSAAGNYSATVSNAKGSATSQVATLTVEGGPIAPALPGSRLINLATRAKVGTGGDILIAGFVIEGNAPRKVVVRAVGEELVKFGVTGQLRDPLLKVFDSAGKQIATNDEWDAKDEDFLVLDAAARQVGAFGLSGGTRDAALIAELAPGSYTAQVSDFMDQTGVALVEIYEFGARDSSRLINLSSRAVVGKGSEILIPSLVIASQDGSQTPRRLLVRAVGPGLTGFGVGGALADPTMKVYRGQTIVAENDNWSTDAATAATLEEAMKNVGAFPLERGSKDAALLLDLPPGDYTIQTTGAGETTGVALVEVYELKH